MRSDDGVGALRTAPCPSPQPAARCLLRRVCDWIKAPARLLVGAYAVHPIACAFASGQQPRSDEIATFPGTYPQARIQVSAMWRGGQSIGQAHVMGKRSGTASIRGNPRCFVTCFRPSSLLLGQSPRQMGDLPRLTENRAWQEVSGRNAIAAPSGAVPRRERDGTWRRPSGV